MTEPHGFVAGAYRVTARNLKVWRQYAAASAVGNVGEPLLYLIALGYGLGTVVPPLSGMSYAEFIAPALVVTTVMYSSTFEGTFGSYTRLTAQKTFDAILASPITPRELVVGEIVWGGVKAAFGAAAVLSVITAFGLVPAWTALGVIPLGFVGGLLFMAMALIVTAISKSYEFFNYYFTIVIAPMFLFSGVFFPLEQMPTWVGHAAQALPLTHVVVLARALVRGTLNFEHLGHFGALFAFLIFATAVCVTLFERRLRV
jgi:lipooligosaccharide transport system permease protein